MINSQKTNIGWVVSRSILMELDTAITFCCGSTISRVLPPDLASLAETLPEAWRKEYIGFMGEVEGLPSTLEQMAMLAGTLRVEDYQHASLPIRNLTFENALTFLKEQAKQFDLNPDDTLPVVDRIADLKNRINFELYKGLGFEIAAADLRASDRFHELRQGVRVLQGGDLHEQFWQWMDRFYYQIYEPWRLNRLSRLAEQQNKVITALGGPESFDTHPQLDWLDEKNALRSIPELKKAVLEDRLHVFFWIEPFGLHDNWLLEPGHVTVSCSEPGQLFDNFFHFTDTLAERIQALSDPTRLLILRLIRNFGMTNTDMANYLGISRPTVSIHASILRHAGLIKSEQDGRIMRHEIVAAELTRLFNDLEKFLDLPGKHNSS